MINKNIIDDTRKQIKFSDRGIFEKAVYAFRLLAGLLKYYPDLVFKGGTSILLHIFPPARFSIDIDILLNKKDKDTLESNLKKLVAESDLFISVEEDKRESNIPKAHYKFYYKSHYVREQQYILLDIVFCEYPYHKTIEKELKGHPLVLIETEAVANVPTPDGLFGDKLTAISPRTIGLPLNEKREMEFVKQVIDLGNLFDLLTDVRDIKNTFVNTLKLENSFRRTNHKKDEIINDIINVAFKYSQHLLKGSKTAAKEIERVNSGLKRVGNHLVSKYTQSDLKFAFARIAYICCLIQQENDKVIIKTIDYPTLSDMRLKGKYEILEGLKKTNPQAYFYWVLGYGEKS